VIREPNWSANATAYSNALHERGEKSTGTRISFKVGGACVEPFTLIERDAVDPGIIRLHLLDAGRFLISVFVLMVPSADFQ
jgi:hypothetical protein